MKQYIKTFWVMLLLAAALPRASAQFYNDGGTISNIDGTINDNTIAFTNAVGSSYTTVGSTSAATFNHLGAAPTFTNNAPYNARAFGVDNFFAPGGVPGLQQIAGTVRPIFSTLNLQNGAGQAFNITNTAGVYIERQLNFINGITTTTDNATFTNFVGAIQFGDTATYIGGTTNTQHVNGYVGKTSNAPFIFPVGHNNVYSPATFSNPNGTTLRYLQANAGSTTVFLQKSGIPELKVVSDREYYPIQSNAPQGSRVSIPFENFAYTGPLANFPTLTIAGWNGTAWENLGQISNTLAGGRIEVILNRSLNAAPAITKITLGNGNPNSLPVTLVSFTGVANTGCGTDLAWRTVKEINNARYEVEYAANGSDFITVGIVSSHNSATGASYVYTHNSPAQGTGYYRLKMVDLDGKVAYSNVIRTSISCTTTPIVIAPNPVSTQFTIKGLTGTNTILIYNSAGAQITRKTTGNALETVTVSGWSRGTYVIQVVNSEGRLVTTQKVIKN